MKLYGMFTDVGDRKIDELVNSEDFPTLSFPEVEKKLEALTRLTGPEIEPEPIFGPAGLLGIRKEYEVQCYEMEREATEDGFETFKPFVEATDTVVCEMVYIAWGRVRELHTRPVRSAQLLRFLSDNFSSKYSSWSDLPSVVKVQTLLDAAAKINPDVQDVADTLVATIYRVKGD
jgi:hypothetical protein